MTTPIRTDFVDGDDGPAGEVNAAYLNNLGAIVNSLSGPPAAASASVATTEATSSTAYTDLATTTDTVDVTIGEHGIALVAVTGWMHGGAAGRIAYIGFTMSGANIQAASDLYATYLSTPSSGGTQGSSAFVLTGLTPGLTTFKMKYRSSSTGACDFANRTIGVLSW